MCRGLADSTVRQIHWIISGALDRAVVWQWISVNPAEHASKLQRARLMRATGASVREMSADIADAGPE